MLQIILHGWVSSYLMVPTANYVCWAKDMDWINIRAAVAGMAARVAKYLILSGPKARNGL